MWTLYNDNVISFTEMVMMSFDRLGTSSYLNLTLFLSIEETREQRSFGASVISTAGDYVSEIKDWFSQN